MKPQIHTTSIAKVMESILPEWRNVTDHDTEEAALARAELIELNEGLNKAFYRSEYAQKHIDWDYAVELIYAVLSANTFQDAKGFAEQLNEVVASTAHKRDLVLVVPLAFSGDFGLFRKLGSFKRFALGPFTLARSARNVAALNDLLAAHGAAPITAADFAHQHLQSHQALGTHPLLTIPRHGSPDALRFQPDAAIRRLIGLIELFGRAHGPHERFALTQPLAARHVFVANNGRLMRFPAQASLSVSLPLTPALIKVLKQPEFARILSFLDAQGAKKGLIGRLRNALSFSGRAIQERDHLTRLLFLVIAMEAIFSRDKNAPIKTTLADYVTFLGFKPEFRRDIHKDLRDIYDVRSQIVHSGVSRVDRALVLKAEQLATRAIYGSLALAISVKVGTGSHEDFFLIAYMK